MGKKLEQGDITEIEKLIEVYYSDILRYCNWFLFNKQWAEEATQETFLKVIRYYDKYVHKGKFKSFVYTVAKNTCIDIQRKNKSSQIKLEELTNEIVYLEKGYEEVDEGIQLRHMVKSLSIDMQEIVVLRFAQSLTIREIALAMNLPLRTVQSKLRLALKKLRKEMHEEDN